MTGWVQDTLDVEPAPAAAGVWFVTVCPRCGDHLDALHLADPAGRWTEPVLWGYVAQAEHDTARHPGTGLARR